MDRHRSQRGMTMADDPPALRTFTNHSPVSEQPTPPIRNLRRPESRPPAADADRKAQGLRLMAARQKFFKTASMSARALGIAGPTYLAHENGTRQIRGDIAIFYAKNFEVSPDWLLLNKGTGPDLSTVEGATAFAPPGLAASPAAADEHRSLGWKGAGLMHLLSELKVSIGPPHTFLRDAAATEPGRLPPPSETGGWIAELAPPRPGHFNECLGKLADNSILDLRDVLLIPALSVEAIRLFAARLPQGTDLLGGQHVFVDPDDIKRI